MLLLKHMRGWSYEDVTREVRANLVYREFTGIGGGKVPDDKTMGRLARQLGPEAIQKLHQRTVAIALENKVVAGRKMRVDTTVVETNIHYPTDSTLMGDGVRVLIRVMKKVAAVVGEAGTKFRDRSRSVKRRVLEIAFASRDKSEKGQQKMKVAYGKLLEATSRVVGQAKQFSTEIAGKVKKGQRIVLQKAKQQLDEMMPRVQQVMQQARERVLRGNTRASNKILSVFEPATEIIRKGKASKPTEFGKMVKIQEAENQIVIHCEVFDQRPSDSDLLTPSIEKHKELLGRVPISPLPTRDSSPPPTKPKPKTGREASGHSQPLHQKRETQAGTKEALVQEGAEVAHRLRRPHQRSQTATWVESVPLQGRSRHQTLGGSGRHRR